MATLTRTIMIDAPVKKVYEYVLDIGKFWNFPDVALTDVHLAPEGVGTSARMFSHIAGFHIEGGVEYVEVVPRKRIVAKVHFFAESPTWTFTFEPVDGGTTMTAVGEWHVKLPVAGRPIEAMMVREHESFVDRLLAQVKDHVEVKAVA